MGAMLFAGVFDRYPRLKVGSVEHEASWIPHWLKQMDFVYTERPVFTKGWKSREGLLPSEYWRRNMFVEFMEDDIGVKLRDYIGVETMLWGSDYPHSEATFPRSQQFLARMFDGVPGAGFTPVPTAARSGELHPTTLRLRGAPRRGGSPAIGWGNAVPNPLGPNVRRFRRRRQD
jgi:hypothetical protein